MRLIVRDFPLSGHEHAFLAAQAANCAGDQGKYWEYYDLLFNNQKALEREKLKEYAGKVGLDPKAFMGCLDSSKYAVEVEQDRTDGEKVGVSSTPTFFINGKRFLGKQTFADFKQRIDQELN